MVKMLVASLKEIAPSKMNRRGACLVLTLCKETFRALKNGIHHRAQLCPNPFPAQMISKKQIKFKNQPCGTVNLCLYLGKKTFCSLS